MNLLSLLLTSMLSEEAIKNIAKVTGLSTAQVRRIVPLAVPMLLRYLTNNASSKEGADSLLGALKDHNDDRTIAEQLLKSDEADGEKILGHIFGSGSNSVIGKLARMTGLTADQTKIVLAVLAPVILSSLYSALTSSGKKAKKTGKSNYDLTPLIGMFMGKEIAKSKDYNLSGLELIGNLLLQEKEEKKSSSKKEESKAAEALLGTLLTSEKEGKKSSSKKEEAKAAEALLGTLLTSEKEGKKSSSKKEEAKAAEALLGGLLGADDKKKKKKEKDSEVIGLLGSLLGEGAGAKDTTEEMVDGSELLALLEALGK
ncbi:MAG: DUF937 domain-containing protein [Solobacterium sp.]|nr:DUF937 domain-containing protein [Solobacterium sp.]